MKCEICMSPAGCDNDIYKQSIHALAERVAKLEAAAGDRSDPSNHAQLPAEAGIYGNGTAPAIPDGFALAPGWRATGSGYCGIDSAHCGEDSLAKGPIIHDDGRSRCVPCAIRLGALLPLVPAEPSGTRGEVECAKCQHRISAHGTGGCNHKVGCPCASFAAPAPQPEAPAGTCPKCTTPQGGEWFEGGEVTCHGCGSDLIAAIVAHDGTTFELAEPLPAEPPRCGGGRTDCFCASRKVGTAWCAKCANAWCSQDEDDQNDECRVGPPAERPAPEVACPSGDCPMCANEACDKCGAGCWDSSVSDCDHDVLERHEPSAPSEPAKARGIEYAQPITQPACACASCRVCCPQPTMRSEPAKAPLSAQINALPEELRGYIHQIETNCDPAGTVRDNVLLRDQADALAAKVADLEAQLADLAGWRNQCACHERTIERLTAKLAAAEKERDHWKSARRTAMEDAEHFRAQADARVDEERERCLAWFKFRMDGGRGVLLMHREVEERIASGAPAPVK